MSSTRLAAKLIWRGTQVQKAVERAAVKGLRNAAEYLLDQANKTIPHDEGMMQDSGQASVDEGKLEAAVSYDTPYAVRQHEDTRLRHPNGRRAKWLEKTLEEKQQKLQNHISGEIKKALQGGGNP